MFIQMKFYSVLAEGVATRKGNENSQIFPHCKSEINKKDRLLIAGFTATSYC
jgi:hypothetical protein